ncbi:MAG TPA: hypothetical protein VJV23_12505 [Candidatus Polarisedimenticolia bacterium]|nr:hypothetical protein [Candidatus Polarisedimenticolia bacterium]
MEPEIFVASRLTEGNLIFPTRIVVTEHAVMRRKRDWLRVNEESVGIRNVATVNITTGILWSDIRIESTGGSDPLESHGHTKADARRIKELIETLQARAGAPGAQGASSAGPVGDTRACPWCAEPIKKAARVCRYCGREVEPAVPSR